MSDTVLVTLNCRLCDVPAKIECFPEQEEHTRRLSGLYVCDACLSRRRPTRRELAMPASTQPAPRTPHND